jgi:uncharacterized protein YecE (DUF72 family)
MRLLAGTSGYSYKEWKGGFYPDDLPATRMLSHYSGRLPTVEINNTFYRMPTRKLLVQWQDQVPEEFVFVIKASRRITHDKRLKEVGDPVAYLLEVTSELGPRLGPLLFQLPPHLRKDVSRLRDFLALLPRERRFVIEFRHESWLDDEVHGLLRDHGVALCVNDGVDEDKEGGETPLVPTAGFGYLRLRRDAYTEDELASWVARIRDQGWSEAFVFFKHETTGPTLALDLLRIGRD